MKMMENILEEILRPEIWEKEWSVSRAGDIRHKFNGYQIPAQSLQREDWLSHMAEKTWVDMNTFFPAYRSAIRRAGFNGIGPNNDVI